MTELGKYKTANIMRRTFIIFCLLVFTSSCGIFMEPEVEHDGSVEILNNSNSAIIFGQCFKFRDNNGDTLLSVEEPFIDVYDSPDYYIVKTNSVQTYDFPTQSTKNTLEKQDVWMFFLFDIDTLKNYPWEVIAREYKILKRVDFNSWEDLENCGFTIIYP